MSSINAGWLRPIEVRASISEFISVGSVAFWIAVSSGGAKRADAVLVARVAVQQENNILRERLRALGIDPASIASLAP
jgi:hypothetical protein